MKHAQAAKHILGGMENGNHLSFRLSSCQGGNLPGVFTLNIADIGMVLVLLRMVPLGKNMCFFLSNSQGGLLPRPLIMKSMGENGAVRSTKRQ
jgi:hypothetical protein